MKAFLFLLFTFPFFSHGQVKKINMLSEKIVKGKFNSVKEYLIEDGKTLDPVAYTYVQYLYYSALENPDYNVDSAYIYIQKTDKNLMFKTTPEIYKQYCEEIGLCFTSFEKLSKPLISVAYEIYASGNDLYKLKYFDSLYQKNEFTEKVKTQIEEIEYQAVIANNNLEELQSFLTKYPNSRLHEADVKSRIERILVNNLKGDFNLNGYKQFITLYPKSSFIIELRPLYAKKIILDNQDNMNDDWKTIFINEFQDYKKLGIESDWMNLKKQVVQNQVNRIIESQSQSPDSLLKFSFQNSLYLSSDAKLKLENHLNQILKKENTIPSLEFVNSYISFFGENSIINRIDSLIWLNAVLNLVNANENEIDDFLNLNYERLKKYELLTNLHLLVPVKIETLEINSYGYINKLNNNIEIYPIYTEARTFVDGLAAVKHENKWGFINEKGTVIIDVIYDKVLDFYKGVTCVCKDGVWQIINKQGDAITELKFQQVGYFDSDLINVKSFTGGWGFLDVHGKLVKSFIYRSATAFASGFAVVSEVDEYRLIDKNFTTIDIEPQDGMFFNQLRDNCYHIWESTMKRWIYCEPNAGEANWTPSKIQRIGSEIIVNGIFVFNLNQKGLTLVPIEKFTTNDDNSQAKPSYKKYDVVMTGNGYGYYIKGNEYLGNQSSYDEAEEFINNRAIVKVSDNYLLIDTSGNQIGGIYKSIRRVNRELFIVKDDDLETLMDINGQIMSFDWYDHIEELVFDGTMKVRTDNKYGFIDLYGTQIIEPTYQQVTGFNNGKAIALVKHDCGYKNYKSLCDFNVVIDINSVWISDLSSTRLEFLPGSDIQ